MSAIPPIFAAPATPGLEPFDLDTFLELSHDLFCIAGTDGYFRWLGPAWSQTLGWSEEELRSVQFLDFVHPDDVQPTLDEVATLAEGRTTIAFENRYRTREGGWCWLQWNTVPTDDGTLYCVARNVTGRREEVTRLRRRTRLLEMAGEVAQVGHWRLHVLDGEVTWSREVYRIHGLSPEDAPPDLASGIEAYHPEDRAMVARVVSEAVETGEPFSFEARLLRPDGDVRHVLSRAVCQTDDTGATEVVFGVFMDLTDRKRLETTVRRSERMASLGTLAAGVAHEINNPLTYIQGNLELLAEDVRSLGGAPSEAHLAEVVHLLDEAREGAERVREIVSGLKAFSRVDERVREPVDVVACLDASLSMAATELRHRATVTRRISDVPAIRGDRTQLIQVFLNLLVNAAQAFPPEGTDGNRVAVEVDTDPHGRVRIRITDNGPGIPDAILSRVFDPFFTTKPPGVGTGLGLPIVLGIVEEMDGTVGLESPSGAGTRVTVTLPPDSGVPVVRRADPAAAPIATEGSVLVVDDDPAVRGVLRRALTRDHEVEVASGGREALRMLEEHPVQVVLLDMMMPDLTGREVYQRLAPHRPELLPRLVFVTGGSLEPELERFLEEIPNPILRKPFEIQELRRLVAEMVDRLEDPA